LKSGKCLALSRNQATGQVDLKEGEIMSFPAKCPKCGCSLVGVKIKQQGKATWSAVNDLIIRSGMVKGRIAPPPGCNLFYIVTAFCQRCKTRQADILMADSSDPVTSAEYKVKVARYKASTTLTAEMLAVEGGDVQIATMQSDKPKTKASIKVIYHVGVDQEKVNELVKEVGSHLIAGVDAQIAQGRPPQAMMTIDGIHLSACSQASAREQGVVIEEEYLVFGMPEDCEIARKNKEMMAHPNSVQVPLELPERSSAERHHPHDGQHRTSV
jgi:hypothetical protein